MECNGGLHGALILDAKRVWHCMLCGKEISQKEIEEIRESIIKEIEAKEDKNEVQ